MVLPSGRGCRARRAAAILGAPALVVGAAAGLLRLLAAVPGLLQPCPHAAPGRWESLARAERELGVEIWVPAYLPAGAAWPPRRIRCMGDDPLTVLLVVELGAAAAGASLYLTQALGPAPFFPQGPRSGVPTEAAPVAVDGEGILRVERGPDGRTWREVSWTHRGRRLSVRAPLDAEEILRVVRSIRPAAGRWEGS